MVVDFRPGDHTYPPDPSTTAVYRNSKFVFVRPRPPPASKPGVWSTTYKLLNPIVKQFWDGLRWPWEPAPPPPKDNYTAGGVIG